MNKPTFAVQSRFWLTGDKQSLAGRGRIELLELIAETGSIRQAAISMGMSYRTAWDAVDSMNQRAGALVVLRKVGGHRGGGAELSAEGRRLVSAFRQVEQEHQVFVDRLNKTINALLAD